MPIHIVLFVVLLKLLLFGAESPNLKFGAISITACVDGEMKLDKYYDKDATRQNEPEPVHEEHVHKKEKLGERLDFLVHNKYAIIAIALMIIVVNIVVRAGLLQYQGLFEPDGFFYYSVIMAEISAHYHLVNYLALSGFPSHNFIGEAPGLVYLTVIFYYLLHGITGLSALTIMRWMPILFGIMYAILAFLLAKQLTKSNAVGLLAMLLVSLSSGNIARTAGTVYRGDSFITLFIMVALFFMLKCFEEKNRVKKYIYAILASASLGTGIVIWNGSPFIIVIYMFALLLIVLYGFIKSDKEILFSSLILSIALLFTNVLQRLYISLGWARAGLVLAGNDFFLFYLPILVGCIAAYYIVHKPEKFKLFSTWKNRALTTIGAAIVVLIIFFAFFGSTITNIASPLSPSQATVNSSVAVSIIATTQELQKPTYGFLWSSFNLQLFLAPLGVVLFLIFAYMLYRNNRFIKREHFNLNAVGFLVLSAYFVVTAYLQASAIRFNAIISVPLSIFAAFGIYALAKLFYDTHTRRKALTYASLCIFLIFIIVMIYFFYPTLKTPFVVVTGAIIVVYILLIALFIYSLYLVINNSFTFKYIVLAIILVILVYNFYNTYFESYTATQADGINPQFLQAMSWMRNNTASNATVLALWPDGSVVEAWANRTSYMDSVGGENGTRIYFFSKFLFNDSPDTQYLYSIHQPEYLVVRNFWYEELGGIAQEGLVANASEYGYVTMSGLNSTSNGTASFFTFSSDTAPYYKTELVIQQGPNGTSEYHAFLGFQNSTRYSLMRNVIFLNTSNAAYTFTPTGNATNSVNFTLLVSYSGREISGAYILGPELVESNLFKFTFLCNYFECPYDTDNVSMHAVYINGDTRIFKINYT